MTIGSLYAPDGTYLGPVPEWLTIPERAGGYPVVSMIVARGMDVPAHWRSEDLRQVDMVVNTMTFEVAAHRNGAGKYRMIDQKTVDAFNAMKERAERWFS